MKCIVTVMLSLSVLPHASAAEDHALGFLLNERVATVPFQISKAGIGVRSEESRVNFIGKPLQVFFDGKSFGPFQIAGSGKSPAFFEAKVPDHLATQLAKPFSSKEMKFSWGKLAGLKPMKRPLLFCDIELSDPEAWRPVQFTTWPSEIRKQILGEVLAHRRSQKCTLPESKMKVLIVTEGDLEIGRAYQNKKGDRRAVSVNVKEIEKLAECDGNEMGIPGAFVVQSGGVTTDLLKSQNWNYRSLEILEAADVNQDGISELFFVDYGYNSDGFSVYDFKTGKLTTSVSSSH